MSAKPTILYLTDLSYEARGRRYCDEDIFVSSQLRQGFTVVLCHPLDAVALMDDFDVTVVRNTGPVIHYQAEYDRFRARALESGVRVYNPLTGKADMVGKRYLVDLSRDGYPVIPTVDRPDDLGRLPGTAEYAVKPMLGADSIGLRFVGPEELDRIAFGDVLVQPRIDFVHEVSFYFVDHAFQYALYAPRPDRRWELEPYRPDATDLAFAQRFVDWNSLDHGIQRVDACRTRDGELLLVELEDLNPYLSLDALDATARTAFVSAMERSVLGLLRG
ncbi:hypothetical protein [Streptosporangium sp. NPDC003464]